jgi:hypothetical protein
MTDDRLTAEAGETTASADAATPAYVHHTDDDHSHTHTHGALGAHTHRHRHADGEHDHRHEQDHPLHARHPDHPTFHPGG